MAEHNQQLLNNPEYLEQAVKELKDKEPYLEGISKQPQQINYFNKILKDQLEVRDFLEEEHRQLNNLQDFLEVNLPEISFKLHKRINLQILLRLSQPFHQPS